MSIREIKTSTELNKNIFDHVLFFSIAESGAMGEPGGVVVINAAGEVFLLNYVWYEYSLADIEKIFPVLTECIFGLFGIDSVVPKGWNYVNLGFGNHLIVSDEVYSSFSAITKNCKEPVEYYTSWFDAAKKILNISEEYE